jgi:hypothetical protein
LTGAWRERSALCFDGNQSLTRPLTRSTSRAAVHSPFLPAHSLGSLLSATQLTLSSPDRTHSTPRCGNPAAVGTVSGLAAHCALSPLTQPAPAFHRTRRRPPRRTAAPAAPPRPAAYARPCKNGSLTEGPAVESSRASSPHRAARGWARPPADTSRSNLADAKSPKPPTPPRAGSSLCWSARFCAT